MNFTPSARGSFIAGIGFWALLWAALFKSDDFAEACGVPRWFSSERCLRWISKNRATTLIGTEVCNYAHTGLDPLGVTFALGGTVVNVLMIYVVLPLLDKAKHRRSVLGIQR